MLKIRKDDIVKVITGSKKGTTGKVLSVDYKKRTVTVAGIGERHRHVRKSQLNPMGGSKDIHVPMDISKVALVTDEKSATTSRVAFETKDGKKVRVARQNNNKEIK